ncbi:MAG: HAD family hydrolase [Chloroflexota bacterium]
MQTILFFDLDATLVQNKFSRKAIGPLIQQIADASGESSDVVFKAFGDENWRRQQNDPDNVLTMDWDDILRTVAQQFDVTLDETVDARWTQFANAEDVEILDQAPVVLKLLQQSHRTLVISTKGLMKYQLPVLEVTGLKAFFVDILTPDVTGYLKTSPDYFAKYKEHDALKIQIGDHYYDDVICAKHNGFKSIMRVPIDDLSVYDPFERPELLSDFQEQIHTYPQDGTDILPDAVVVSLQELPDVIKRLEAD